MDYWEDWKAEPELPAEPERVVKTGPGWGSELGVEAQAAAQPQAEVQAC
jgi:hypothetical protein